MTNINSGHNEGMLGECKELSGYNIFVDKVREYKKTIPDKDAAFREVINDCIEHNILREFLKSHATEVLEMLLTEWNTEEALAFKREEGRDEVEKKRALQAGVSPELARIITGLPMEAIKGLSAQ